MLMAGAWVTGMQQMIPVACRTDRKTETGTRSEGKGQRSTERATDRQTDRSTMHTLAITNIVDIGD